HDEPGHDSFLGIYQIEPQEVFTLPRRTMPGSERVRAECRTCQSESAQRLGMVRAAARRRRAAGRHKDARAEEERRNRVLATRGDSPRCHWLASSESPSWISSRVGSKTVSCSLSFTWSLGLEMSWL